MAVPLWIANISRISNTLFLFCVFFQVPCLLAGRYSYELPEYVVKVDSKQLKMPKVAMDVAVDHLVKQFYETDMFTKLSQNISTCRKELINVTKNIDNLFLCKYLILYMYDVYDKQSLYFVFRDEYFSRC